MTWRNNIGPSEKGYLEDIRETIKSNPTSSAHHAQSIKLLTRVLSGVLDHIDQMQQRIASYETDTDNRLTDISKRLLVIATKIAIFSALGASIAVPILIKIVTSLSKQ